MNNRERKKSNSSGSMGLAIIAVLLLTRGIIEIVSNSNIFGIIIPIIIIAIIGTVLGFRLGKKKSGVKDSVYYSERSKEAAKRIFMREEIAQNEQAVKCTHHRGKEKYFVQLDNYLTNGLIDKNEYRVLKERYEKLSIPEDMH